MEHDYHGPVGVLPRRDRSQDSPQSRHDEFMLDVYSKLLDAAEEQASFDAADPQDSSH